ncbi:MAG: ABC transporter ATP-binding protein [Clostridia bacterium]|nr:ABC transporter ATP-binding protein [Clostridia bacterium]
MAIELKNVTFSYGGEPVVTDFSLTVPDNGVLCLFGPSGCGKTTLLRLLLGLEQPESGTIHRRVHKPAMVFQEDRLLPWKSVLENVTLSAKDEESAKEALRAVGLTDELFEARPATLSGGMQRRVAIARALAADSDWLVLDEPFTGLDAEKREEILELVRAYAATRPVVLVTHHPEEIALLGAETVNLA